MAKTTSRKSTKTAPKVADSGLRWALGIGMTVITDEPVNVNIAPTKSEQHNRRARFVNEIMPAIVKLVTDAGYAVGDDTRAETGPLFPCRANGAPVEVVFPYAEPTPRSSGNGAHVAEDAVGPLATQPASAGSAKRGKKAAATEVAEPETEDDEAEDEPEIKPVKKSSRKQSAKRNGKK